MYPSQCFGEGSKSNIGHVKVISAIAETNTTQDMKQKINTAAAQKILFLPHAVKQMSRPDKMITTDEVKKAVLSGEIIEEYPEDQRGESCLVMQITQNRIIHVVCAPKAEYLAVITAYLPLPDQWSSDFKTRR